MNDFLTLKGDYCFFFKGEFNQWWPSRFVFEGIQFWNCEQFMMWSKAILFDDQQIARKIIDIKSPAAAKSLGREVKNFNQEIWNSNKYEIVFRGNLYKYNANEGLKSLLISTRPYQLVEANGTDRIWGIGKYVEDPDLMNEDEWGENLLGKILTEIRDSY